MKDSQKPDHVSLANMVGRLREGRYVIPDFQHDFEWEPWDIKELMSSIFRDYYIGSLLLWKGKDESFEALSCEAIYGFEGGDGRTDIVLDGQQRLTAMYYAFMAPNKPAPNRRNRFLYFIKVDRFMDEVYDDAFIYDWTRRGLNLLSDRTRQFKEHMFPLSVVGAGGWELPNWVQGYEKHWREAAETLEGTEAESAAFQAENAKKFGEHLKDITEQYQISYIELDRDLELDKVCDIFTKINSRGVRLDIFDLLNALLRYVDDNAEPGSISEFQRDIDNLDLRRETRRGTSFYNGVFNLLVLNGARDWISGNAPQHGDLDDHHIVPKSLGSQYALSTSIDTILNRTPLTSETNRKVIRDRLPNEYLPELIATNGKDEVMRILESHFISARAFDILMKNPFTPGDFEKFIEERGNTLRSRIKDLAGQVGL